MSNHFTTNGSQKVTNNWPQNTDAQIDAKSIALSSISSIMESLKNIDKISVPSMSILVKIDGSTQQISVKLTQLLDFIEDSNKCGDTNTKLLDISTKSKKLFQKLRVPFINKT